MLDRDDVARLLREVGEELASRDVRGHLFLVGGAAMAVAYGRDRVTRDVDAVFEPKQIVYEAARAVGRRHGLGDDWLNDGVKGFLRGADPDATTFLDEPGLVVQIASPHYLFTLKALAARVDRDAADLLALYRLCGFASVEEALDHVQQTAPTSLLGPKTQFLLREVLDPDPDQGLPMSPAPTPRQPRPSPRARPRCGHPLPRGGSCTERPGHRGRHRRRR